MVKGKVYADIFLVDPINTKSSSKEKSELLELFKNCKLSDKIKTQVECMIHIPYLQALAKTVLNSVNTLFQTLKESKQTQQQMINFIISLDSQNSDFPSISKLIDPSTTAF